MLRAALRDYEAAPMPRSGCRSGAGGAVRAGAGGSSSGGIAPTADTEAALRENRPGVVEAGAAATAAVVLVLLWSSPKIAPAAVATVVTLIDKNRG